MGWDVAMILGVTSDGDSSSDSRLLLLSVVVWGALMSRSLSTPSQAKLSRPAARYGAQPYACRSQALDPSPLLPCSEAREDTVAWQAREGGFAWNVSVVGMGRSWFVWGMAKCPSRSARSAAPQTIDLDNRRQWLIGQLARTIQHNRKQNGELSVGG